MESYPHPEADWAGFKATIERLNAGSARVFSPMGSGAPRPWVDLAKVRQKRQKQCCVTS